MKADKKDLDRIYDVKCNKIEFENCLDIQNIMCKQFKHILVLFIEMMNFETGKIHSTKQGQEKKLKNLMFQIHSFTNWVMNFEPVNYMNSADAAGIQVMNMAVEDKFKDYTDQVLQDLNKNKNLVGSGPPN